MLFYYEKSFVDYFFLDNYFTAELAIPKWHSNVTIWSQRQFSIWRCQIGTPLRSSHKTM